MSPLSDAELRVLADIERHLADDPPADPPGTDRFSSPFGVDPSGVGPPDPARPAPGWGVPVPLVVGWVATCLVFFALVTGAPPLLLAAGVALVVPVGGAVYRLRHRRGRR